MEPPEDDVTVVNPGLMLKYSTYKNLASMAYQKNDLNGAMEHYLNVGQAHEWTGNLINPWTIHHANFPSKSASFSECF